MKRFGINEKGSLPLKTHGEPCSSFSGFLWKSVIANGAELGYTDLGEEATVVSGQNHLHHIFQSLHTQHVCCQHHLTTGEETPLVTQVWGAWSHFEQYSTYLALAPEGRSKMAPYMNWSKMSISSGPKLKDTSNEELSTVYSTFLLHI